MKNMLIIFLVLFSSVVYAGDSHMEITSDGIVGFSKQSAVSVYANYPLSNIPNDNPQKVVLNDVKFDVQGEWDTVSGTYTAKENGIYMIVGYINWSESSWISGKLYSASIRKNGLPTESSNMSGYKAGNHRLGVYVHDVVELNAYDTIELYASHIDGTNNADVHSASLKIIKLQ